MHDEGMVLRVPPQSVEAEQAVLGGLMIAPNAFERIADIVGDKDFYRRDHAFIYRAIQELSEKGEPYDAVTVGEWFESMHLDHEIDPSYLIELASTTPSAANIVAYAKIIRDKSVLRSLIDAGTEIVNDGFNPDGRDTQELLAVAEARVMGVGGLGLKDLEDGVGSLKRTVRELARRRAAGPDALLGVTSGLDAVDNMTYGLQPTDLIILAARPSMGKTALMRHMARAAARAGHRPYTLEMEMGAEMVHMRDIAAVGRVDFRHVQRPALASHDEMERMREAIRKMQPWKWWLDDQAAINVKQIAARLRRAKRQHDIGIAFIDYLQFIDLGRAENGTAFAIQEVTRRLKALAKELAIPIVLLSQLNRALETRGDKRPILADLRESGAIEQDADVVMFLHRQGYYQRDWAKDDPRQAMAEIIIAKARNGEIGSTTVNWQGRYQSFGDMTYENTPPTYYESKGSGFEPKRLHGLAGSHDD